MRLKPPVLSAAAAFILAGMFCLCDSAISNPPDKAAVMLERPHVTGELLVRIRPGTGNAVENFVKSRNAKFKVSYRGGLSGLVLIRLSKVEHTTDLLRALLKRTDVIYAEPNYIVEPALAPDDPQFYRSWGLHNTGQRYRTAPRRSGTEDIDIDAPEAWDTTTGSLAVVVAVIDTGVNYGHSELSASIWVNTDEVGGNSVDDDLNGYVDDIRGWNFHENNNDPGDPDGHGTSAASIAGALGNNAAGTSGVCWSVSIMPLRVGLGETGSISEIISAIQYAVNNGAHVINASWGTSSYSQSLYDAISAARAANVVFVAAAGNSSSNIDASPYYPASYPLDNIVAVAAVDSNGNLASFSNYGSVSVDIAAPGVDIYTIDGDSYSYISGTSAAAPFVSGAAALLISANPGIPYSETCSRIVTCANRLEGLSGRCVSAGMLNAYNALSYGQPAVVVDSVSQNVLGAGDSATITWTCKHDGTYSVEVGGSGTAGSGFVVGSGTCLIDDQIDSTVTEADLPDNKASPVYIIIEEAPCAGFAVVTLYDDQTGPTSQIEYPTQGSTLGTLSQITGTAADTGGAEVASVSVAIHDGSLYYDGAAFTATDPVYLSATGTTGWSFDSSSVPWSDGTSYSLYVQAQDTVANLADGENPVSFTYLTGAPTIIIESVSQQVLGAYDSATITWRSDLAGTYAVRVGATDVETGTCAADTPVNTIVTESDLADNSASTIHIFVTASSITGSVSTILYDDQTAPVSNTIYPLHNKTYTELAAILGRASDTGGAYVAAVEVQITDGVRYWDGNAFADSDAWVAADGTNEWSLDTSSVPWADFTYYTVKTRATDSVGNVESPSAGVTFYFNSGTTPFPKKKSSGCNLSNSEGSSLSTLLLFLTILTVFYLLRRRRTTTLETE